MASDFSYAEDLGIKTKSSKKMEKGIKKLFIVTGVILGAQLIWLFGISPFIPFSTIEVHEIAGLSRAEILKYSGIDESSSFISTSVKEVQQRLEGHLLVDSAIVTKRFPDKLSVFINPRQAAAVALANVNSRQVPVYVDRKGVFFRIGNADSLEANLPVLSGFENPKLNMRLPAGLIPLVESLCDISASSPQLLSAVSEIRIEHKAWDGFDLVVFPVHSSIKVRLENNLTEDVLRYMFLILNVMEENSQKPSEIDFRSGMGAYRVKEQSL